MLISKSYLFTILLLTGFERKEAEVMVCIAEYESSYKIEAVNTNFDGSLDLGLYQINQRYWGHHKKCQAKDMFVPEFNVECAKVVYDHMGFNAWYGYQYNKDKCDTYRYKTNRS